MDYPENQLFNTYLSSWYKFYSDLYTDSYPNYRYVYGLNMLFEYILNERRNFKKYQDVVTFYKVTQKSDKWFIGSILLSNMNATGLLKNTCNFHIETYRSDVEHIMDIIRKSVHIMEYLLNKYDYVYIEHWRNKDVIMKYVNDSYYLEQFALDKFKNAGKSSDLLEGYDSITKMAYNGLMVTSYVRYINEDCLKQSDYINPIHINNISQEFFDLSRHEICEAARYDYYDFSDDDD